MEPTKPNLPGTSGSSSSKKSSDNRTATCSTGTSSAHCAYNGQLPVMDTSLTQLRNQVINISNNILRDSIAYVDIRLHLQTATRMRLLYENNRPVPAWLKTPLVQEHMTTFLNVQFFEDSLQAQKDIIKEQKEVLICLYNEMRQFYTEHQAAVTAPVPSNGARRLGRGLCVDIRTKIADIFRDVNVKVLHVMTALELMMTADNRTNLVIDGTLHQQYGAPAPVPVTLD